MARLTVYTHPSRLGSLYNETIYPRTYARIAGLAVVPSSRMWVYQRDLDPNNGYDRDGLDEATIELDDWLARRIVRYFHAHFAAATERYDRSCHHFACTMLDPERTLAFRPERDPSNLAALEIVERGVEVSGALPMGVHGVFGVRGPDRTNGYHSVIGLGEGKQVIQVVAMDGNLGLGSVEDIAANVEATDHRGTGPVRLFVAPNHGGGRRSRSRGA